MKVYLFETDNFTNILYQSGEVCKCEGTDYTGLYIGVNIYRGEETETFINRVRDELLNVIDPGLSFEDITGIELAFNSILLDCDLYPHNFKLFHLFDLMD